MAVDLKKIPSDFKDLPNLLRSDNVTLSKADGERAYKQIV